VVAADDRAGDDHVCRRRHVNHLRPGAAQGYQARPSSTIWCLLVFTTFAVVVIVIVTASGRS
jgi:hypothetical protein